MVFLPSRSSLHDGSATFVEPLSRGARAIIDLLDVVGTIRDGDHLQCVMYLAQEFGLVAQPLFLFGSIGAHPRRPHSSLLESHFYTLLHEGIVDVDGNGHLRLRRDLFALPPCSLNGRRLAALGTLSAEETALFAAAVLRLAADGLHAGSLRHTEAFDETIASFTSSDDRPIDIGAICATRRRMLPADPVMLTPV